MLTIENLSVDYVSHGTWTPALQNFSLTMSAGEAVGLVGPSGSGKSTVALAVMRLIRPMEGRIASGHIVYQGKDLLAVPEYTMRQIRGQHIGMIFQDPFTALNPVLRIDTQLAEALQAHGRPATAAILEQSVREVQLDPQRTLLSYPHQLSGGQRQRVMIAMALLCKPKLLLADEPTTALDVLVQKEILDLISKLQKERQIAVLFITHNLKLLERYTSRVVTVESLRKESYVH